MCMHVHVRLLACRETGSNVLFDLVAKHPDVYRDPLLGVGGRSPLLPDPYTGKPIVTRRITASGIIKDCGSYHRGRMNVVGDPRPFLEESDAIQVLESVLDKCGSGIKLVVVLRDPVDRIELMHQWREQNHRLGTGNCSDDADARSATFDSIMDNTIARSEARYREMAQQQQATFQPDEFFDVPGCAREYLLPNAYALHLANTLRSFPPTNVMVLFHEEMEDLATVVQKVVVFLGGADASTKVSAAVLGNLAHVKSDMARRPPGSSTHVLGERTKRNLCRLFSPFNQQLARMLGTQTVPFRTCGASATRPAVIRDEPAPLTASKEDSMPSRLSFGASGRLTQVCARACTTCTTLAA